MQRKNEVTRSRSLHAAALIGTPTKVGEMEEKGKGILKGKCRKILIDFMIILFNNESLAI